MEDIFQQENTRLESEKLLVCQENSELQQELDFARERLENLNKLYDDLDTKSKADLKILVKEVKSLRSSQSELKHELGRLMKEKLELEVICLFVRLFQIFHLRFIFLV